MNKLLFNVSPFHFLSVGKDGMGPFQGNCNDSWLALSQLNGSKGIYGYKASNLDSQNKICIFLLAFFLLYIIWSPKLALKLFQPHHSHPNNWKYQKRWYRYLYRNCLHIFPNNSPEWIHRENWGSLIHLENIYSENMINKSETLSNYLMENKKSRNEW